MGGGSCRPSVREWRGCDSSLGEREVVTFSAVEVERSWWRRGDIERWRRVSRQMRWACVFVVVDEEEEEREEASFAVARRDADMIEVSRCVPEVGKVGLRSERWEVDRTHGTVRARRHLLQHDNSYNSYPTLPLGFCITLRFLLLGTV